MQAWFSGTGGAGAAGVGGPLLLLDFAAYRPPAELVVNVEEMEDFGQEWKMYHKSVRDFMWRVFVKSGLGPTNTYLPACVHPKHSAAPHQSIVNSQLEAEMVMCGAVSDLLTRTGIRPTEIDVLITTCSIFCSTPSLASMLVNKFKMREDVQAWHLGGMGCANGTMGVSLIRDILKARPNSTCLFVSTEIVSAGFYAGEEKSRMVSNAIFRMGAAAALFTNKASLRSKAKYVVEHSERLHMAASDSSYNCMGWGPDAAGINGIRLGKELVQEAGKAISQIMRTVTPRIMSWRQYGEAAVHTARKLLGSNEESYRPDYNLCVDHFFVHAGGYAVLKGIQESLVLPVSKMMPNFAALREYGNTSSSTTWYAWSYQETCQGVKKGESVVQLGVGGGIKAGCNVYRALRDINTCHRAFEHLAGRPLTEADLPRGIHNSDDIRAPVRPDTGFGVDMIARTRTRPLGASRKNTGASRKHTAVGTVGPISLTADSSSGGNVPISSTYEADLAIKAAVAEAARALVGSRLSLDAVFNSHEEEFDSL